MFSDWFLKVTYSGQKEYNWDQELRRKTAHLGRAKEAALESEGNRSGGNTEKAHKEAVKLPAQGTWVGSCLPEKAIAPLPPCWLDCLLPSRKAQATHPWTEVVMVVELAEAVLVLSQPLFSLLFGWWGLLLNIAHGNKKSLSHFVPDQKYIFHLTLPRHHIFIMILLCHMQCTVSKQVALSCYVWGLIQLTAHLTSGTTGGTKGWKAPPRNGKRKKREVRACGSRYWLLELLWAFRAALSLLCQRGVQVMTCCKGSWVNNMLYADVCKLHKPLVSGARDHFPWYTTYATVENCLLTLSFWDRFLKWLENFLIFCNYCASPAVTDPPSQGMFYICNLNSQLSISH